MTRPALALDVRRARRAYLLVALWIPLAVAVVGVALMLVRLPGMPETIAIHWNAAGTADGFAPAWTTPLIFAAVGIGIPVLFAACALVGSREGEWGPTYRFLGAVALGTTLSLGILITWTFLAQAGLSDAHDAHDAPSILLPLTVGAGIGVVGGAVGWFLQPAVTVSGGRTQRAPGVIALEPGERAVWLRTTSMARSGLIAVIGATILTAVLAVVFALTGVDAWWVLAILAVVLAVAALTTCVFRVRVDEMGLRIASPLGIPRFVVPLADVTGVSVVRVSPSAEFGGWGIRLGVDGRLGVVLHAGPAIQVARRSGRTLVVTIDDAETGAALLASLVDRAGRQG